MLYTFWSRKVGTVVPPAEDAASKMSTKMPKGLTEATVPWLHSLPGLI